MIALVLHLVVCVLDLGHCARISSTAGGLRCVEVNLAPACPDRAGWHEVLGTSVCTSSCGSEGAPVQ